jgi:hypothetical protein
VLVQPTAGPESVASGDLPSALRDTAATGKRTGATLGVTGGTLSCDGSRRGPGERARLARSDAAVAGRPLVDGPETRPSRTQAECRAAGSAASTPGTASGALQTAPRS